MKLLLSILNEHRLQLAIGFAIATIAAFVMTEYESGFEHRYDETFREWIDSEAKSVNDDNNELEQEFRDRKSTRLNSSHIQKSRMPSSA